MRTQFERMIAGDLYLPFDAELGKKFGRCQLLLQHYNQSDYQDFALRESLRHQLFHSIGQNSNIMPPFRCDYGSNITIGDNFYANYDCIFLDAGKITIGNNVMLAPRVGIYTSGHPIDAAVRNSLLEFTKPITIGNDVWIGANTVITPGVSIGNNVVIGAGSVVTHNIPNNCVAVGNPCRILRQITEDDRLYWQQLKDAYHSS